jgi:hypothetical protein
MHEIANAGQPILDGSQGQRQSPTWKSLEADAPVHHLSYVRQHTQMVTKDRQRRFASGDRHHVVVLRGAIDDVIRIVKYSG